MNRFTKNPILYETTFTKAFVTEPIACALSEIFEQKNIARLADNDTNLKLILLELLEALNYLLEVYDFDFRKILCI